MKKMKTLEFTDPYCGQKDSAKCPHLIEIFEDELKMSVKLKLLYASLFPTNFEKQMASLAMDIFNEKTVEELDLRKHDQTKVFIATVKELWHILNVKIPDNFFRLNNEDRKINFIVEMANKCADMNIILALVV